MGGHPGWTGQGGLERAGQEGQVGHLLDLLPPRLLLAWALLLSLPGCWAYTGWSIKGHFTPQFWSGLAHPLFQVDKTTCGSWEDGETEHPLLDPCPGLCRRLSEVRGKGSCHGMQGFRDAASCSLDSRARLGTQRGL